MISGGRAINPDALENTPENPSGKSASGGGLPLPPCRLIGTFTAYFLLRIGSGSGLLGAVLFDWKLFIGQL